jgi:hypothetical protein
VSVATVPFSRAGGCVVGPGARQSLPSHSQVSPSVPPGPNPPNTTMPVVPGWLAMEWLCRAGGLRCGNSCIQSLPVQAQVSPSGWLPALKPPNNTRRPPGPEAMPCA